MRVQDMSRLMHSMHEALEASAKRPQSGAAALKIRLAVTPSAGTHRISHRGDTRPARPLLFFFCYFFVF